MPAKDQARDAAFAAIKTSRNDIFRVCQDFYSHQPSDEATAQIDSLRALLEDRGFRFETGIAGVPMAFRATHARLDKEAMRKGLRHGSIVFIVPLSGAEAADPLGLAAALSATFANAAALETEYGTVTLIGYPDDASLAAMAGAGIFNEFDAAFGARAAADGEGYCFTIDGTGDTLATRTATITIDGDSGPVNVMLSAVAATLAAPNEISLAPGTDGTLELVLTGQTSVELAELSATVQQVVNDAEGANVTFGSITDDTIVNRILARRVKTYSGTLGYKMDKIRKTAPTAPTGWGNVSHATPTFRLSFPTTPTVADGEEAAAEVTEADRQERTIEFATCLGFAALDTLRDMEFRSIADDQLVKALGRRGINRPHRRWLGVHAVIPDPDADKKKKKSGPKMSDFQIVRGPGMRDN